jgi:branched-chain amino acid transport system ATP-binding protein
VNNAADIIRDEHRSMGSVLKALLAQVQAARGGQAEADWPLYDAMLGYLEAFPEVMHHPKEDQFLFARLRERHAPSEPVIRQLEREHVEGAASLKAIRTLLQSAQAVADVNGFAAALEDYATFLWHHMDTEERVVLPMARDHLTAEDWAYIDAAFLANRQPRW